MSQHTINVARDFSRFPAGRYRDDGPFSGEAFRDDHILPILSKSEPLIIELNGVRGFGSSFLEEVFGGLVRIGYTPEQLNSLIELKSSDISIIEEIQEYINHGNDPDQDD